MDFKSTLNKYLDELNCSSKELSVASGLSQTVISRYRNGERVPLLESNQINKLVDAIYNISINRGKKKLNKEELLDSFIKIIKGIKETDFDYEIFSNKFDELIILLNINIIEMSKFMAFDPSYISRIRSNKRKPACPKEFVEKICDFIINKYHKEEDIKTLSIILECKKEALLNKDTYFDELKTWLTNNSSPAKNYIKDFLKNLNEFNLNNYIKAIKFDKLKIPNLPFYITKNKTYYGIEEMKEGELDFFKSTILSKSKEPIFMCSDMPMEDMAKDIEFGKKWMFAIAMALKKGLHLNMIHNIDRPFQEMMLGLESWIPIYMTGQVSPYYLKNNKDMVYCHFNYVSGAAALTGECIKDFHNKGKYYLTSNKKELEYYKTKSKCLLKKANPLMEIYREKQQKNFSVFLTNYEKINGNRHRTLSTLPLFTIKDDLLISMLKRNKISNTDIKNILEYKNNEYAMINNILKNNLISDEINEMSPNDFINKNISLSLEDIFYNKIITYNYSEYAKHLKSTKEFAENNPNYNLTISKDNIFHNIKITIVKNNFVIISKSADPIIHFVIKHPKLRNAIEKFSAPIME